MEHKGSLRQNGTLLFKTLPESRLTVGALPVASASPRLRQPQIDRNFDRVSRILDCTGAILLLLFLMPVIIPIAVLIVVLDPGPVIFAHRRIGCGGRTFYCLKFRTMHVGAEQRLTNLLAQNPELRLQWERHQKLRNDPRVTRFGRLLRLASLDELPQLLNVLRGEMSFVGPRPIVAAEIPRFGRFIESYYAVRPGLTGLWQVSGRSDTVYRRRVATDVLYARKRSLGLNAWILLATIPAVLLGHGSA